MTRNETRRQAIQRRLNAIARKPVLRPAQKAEPPKPKPEFRTDGYRLR